MKISKRFNAPVPSFFKKVRNAGLVIAAAGGAVLASPVELPELLVTAGGYILVAGTVLVAVSQATLPEKESEKNR